MSLVEFWEVARHNLSGRIGPAAYEAWLSKLQAKEAACDLILFEVPDEFSKEWIVKHYLGLIEDALEKTAQKKIRIEFLVQPGGVEPKTQHAASSKDALPQEKNTQTLNLNPRFNFENFIVGPANRFAHAASLAVAESPAKAYNPLFIYGGVGLGKTHLMQAICHFTLQKKQSQFKICYTPSEKFTNELIDAIQHHSTARFRAKYRSADLLVIDDVHFIGGKEATQEEFFNTFNSLHDSHKQIIISSDRPPKDILGLEERLVSRFSWGLVTDIQPPDYETRVAILKKKIEHEPVPVPDEVIHYIAQKVKSNIRELEGALIRVVAYSLLENKPISLEIANASLKNLFKESIKVITVDSIQKQVGVFLNTTQQDLKGGKRNKNIVLARQIAMYLSRELTNFSLPEIGNFFGGKDHTTVLHSYNKIKKAIKEDLKIKTIIGNITQVLNSNSPGS